MLITVIVNCKWEHTVGKMEDDMIVKKDMGCLGHHIYVSSANLLACITGLLWI